MLQFPTSFSWAITLGKSRCSLRDFLGFKRRGRGEGDTRFGLKNSASRFFVSQFDFPLPLSPPSLIPLSPFPYMPTPKLPKAGAEEIFPPPPKKGGHFVKRNLSLKKAPIPGEQGCRACTRVYLVSLLPRDSKQNVIYIQFSRSILTHASSPPVLPVSNKTSSSTFLARFEYHTHMLGGQTVRLG